MIIKLLVYFLIAYSPFLHSKVNTTYNYYLHQNNQSFFKKNFKPKLSLISRPTLPIQAGILSPIRGPINRLNSSIFIKIMTCTVVNHFIATNGKKTFHKMFFSHILQPLSTGLASAKEQISESISIRTDDDIENSLDHEYNNAYNYYSLLKYTETVCNNKKQFIKKTRKEIQGICKQHLQECITKYKIMLPVFNNKDLQKILIQTLLSQFALRMQLLKLKTLDISTGIQCGAYIHCSNEQSEIKSSIHSAYTIGVYLKGSISCIIDFIFVIYPVHINYTVLSVNESSENNINFLFDHRLNACIKNSKTLVIMPSWSLVFKINTSSILFADAYIKISQFGFNHPVEITFEFILPEVLGI